MTGFYGSCYMHYGYLYKWISVYIPFDCIKKSQKTYIKYPHTVNYTQVQKFWEKNVENCQIWFMKELYIARLIVAKKTEMHLIN